MNLDVTKSSGVDWISARMLKLTAVSIVSSLAKLFNLSVRTGTFPDDSDNLLINLFQIPS